MLYSIWIILLPLLGAVLSGWLSFSKASDKRAGLVSSSAAFLAFVGAAKAFLIYQQTHVAVKEVWYCWVPLSDFSVNLSFVLDPLSLLMSCVVTGVGFLIHVYSVGYMEHDERSSRYFAYLNLFLTSMLTLVLASNFLVMFFGWELVGLSSYLLIGFWFEKDSASAAGRKAFVVNRIGDFGFLMGIFLVFYNFGTLEFSDVQAKAGTVLVGHESLATWLTFFLFMGAMGKSAQLPLHVWLPDAMEGPTPVSALIHAATMVTAGIYMITRNNALFSMAPMTLDLIATIGGLTAFMAATIGLAQNDLKRIMAYSTVSQLGYMFLGLGVGAYAPAMFHLFTHAFFKALLFLGAGSVMHALSGELDIRKMGGLRSKMPVTFITFTVGALALAGIPGFSGFFSKDEILLQAFAGPRACLWLWALAALTSFITNLYVFRTLFLVFFGESRDHHLFNHAHESPKVMTLPLMFLAFFALFAGYINLPSFLGGHEYFSGFLGPILSSEAHAEIATSTTLGLMVVYTGFSIAAIVLMYTLYLKPSWKVPGFAAGVEKLLANKYYIDEIYQAVIVKPLFGISSWLSEYFDQDTIDGSVNGVGEVVDSASSVASTFQNGQVQTYLITFLAGSALVLLYLFWGRA